MESNYPSIFNDVIGPVMRGPSSSHCAASVRIGRLARDLMGGKIESVRVTFDPRGSLATTHQSQGADMGLFGGFLGWDTHDRRLVDSEKTIETAGIRVEIDISDIGAEHPNTYKLVLENKTERHEMIALSTGGGMIEVIEIDGAPVSVAGDFFETLIFLEADEDGLVRHLEQQVSYDAIRLCRGEDTRFVQVKARQFLTGSVCSDLEQKAAVIGIKKLSPVLPILSGRKTTVPFMTCHEMAAYNKKENLDLWELALRYESARGGISKNQVFEKMKQVVGIMQTSLREGLKGTEYADRILGVQSGLFKDRMEQNRLLDSGILNRIILYVTAMMEIKSAMGVIVAAPTAGACAGLPGACIGAAHAMGLPEDEIVKGMLAAGMIGIFISSHATFAAEVGGCQAECGAGSGMAAAALVTLAKGDAKQAIHASSMALQNILGMVCDPVANRVEVPCLGKNVLGASNAVACANMALADFDPVIPLDEVIGAMDRVGRSLPSALRCTARGGLSVTRTSKAIEEKLKAGQPTSI